MCYSFVLVKKNCTKTDLDMANGMIITSNSIPPCRHIDCLIRLLVAKFKLAGEN